MKRLDLTGFQKGKLTLTSFSHSHAQPSGQKRAMWNAECACGNTTIVSVTNVVHGKTESCGCIRKLGNNKKPLGEASFNHKFLSYKARAKTHKKNLEFNLSKDEFRDLILQPCHYCNAISSMSFKSRTSNGDFVSNGIDRIDSNMGYIKDNCLPCCTICNKMKNNLSYKEFIDHIERIQNATQTRKII